MSSRAPCSDGSKAGTVATIMRPFSLSLSSLGGGPIRPSVSRGSATIAPLVHGSQASPSPSPSPSSWDGFGADTQLSLASQTPSPSPSEHPRLVEVVELVVLVVDAGRLDDVVLVAVVDVELVVVVDVVEVGEVVDAVVDVVEVVVEVVDDDVLDVPEGVRVVPEVGLGVVCGGAAGGVVVGDVVVLEVLVVVGVVVDVVLVVDVLDVGVVVVGLLLTIVKESNSASVRSIVSTVSVVFPVMCADVYEKRLKLQYVGPPALTPPGHPLWSQ